MNHLPTQTSSPTPPNLTQQFCLRWHNHQVSIVLCCDLLLKNVVDAITPENFPPKIVFPIYLSR